MAQNAENLSHESLDIYEETSPEYRTSFKRSSEEATPDTSATSSSQEKERQKRKEVFQQRLKPRSVGEKKQKRRIGYVRKELEELSAWISSAE